jgi:hypothetical protein
MSAGKIGNGRGSAVAGAKPYVLEIVSSVENGLIASTGPIGELIMRPIQMSTAVRTLEIHAGVGTSVRTARAGGRDAWMSPVQAR